MSAFKEHHIIDRQIGDFAIRRNLSGVGQDIGLLDMIILVLDKSIQGAVNGVVLTGLDLEGNSGQAIIIVDQIIDLALAAVVVIKQIITVGDELAGNDALVN